MFLHFVTTSNPPCDNHQRTTMAGRDPTTTPTPIPRSKIYVNTPRSQRYEFDELTTGTHFFLTLPSGILYTADVIAHCGGQYTCFNCARVIQDRIYFYPTDYTIRNEFICNPLPHCRAACTRRTVQDIPNNYDLLSLFFLMYGGDVLCAPSRSLLYLPNAMSLATYHHSIDEKVLLVCEQPHVRSFMSPVYLSCSALLDHQLLPSALAIIKEMNVEDRATIALPKQGTCVERATKQELAAPNPLHTQLSQIFTLNPT
jgi:hypothetical protein